MRWRHKSPYQLTKDEAFARAKELNLGEPLGRYEVGAGSMDDIRKEIANVERERRERWLWLVALISAIASLISAFAAWTAILVAK